MFGGLNDRIEGQRARPSAPTRWWIITCLLGLATLGFSLFLTATFPVDSAAAAPGYGPPVIAFEFARSQNDLLAIFGSATDPLQVARLRAMRTGNEQDYGFMLLYAGFLASGCMALWRDARSRLALAAALLPLFAALCDGYENWLLFDIQSAFTLGDYSPAMRDLWVPVTAKFMLLTFTNILIGTVLTRMAGGWRPLGYVIIIPCFATAMALTAPAAFGWTLTAAIGAGWLALFGMAVIGSWAALVRKQPLMRFDPVRVRRHRDGAATAAAVASASEIRRFGRRGHSDKAGT